MSTLMRVTNTKMVYFNEGYRDEGWHGTSTRDELWLHEDDGHGAFKGGIKVGTTQKSGQYGMPALRGQELGLPAVHLPGMLQVWQRMKAAILEHGGAAHVKPACASAASAYFFSCVLGTPSKKGTHAETCS